MTIAKRTRKTSICKYKLLFSGLIAVPFKRSSISARKYVAWTLYKQEIPIYFSHANVKFLMGVNRIFGGVQARQLV